ncbi:MAG TPA: hypothetical protein PKY82_05825 [Pyrinomonadaceae bacterium]|nr:hypothetical protein [Pyrinomonadaceae bacterium]
MKKIAVFCFIFLFFTASLIAQTSEKIDEFGYFYCGDNSKLGNIYQIWIKDKPQNKIYIIFYEGPREFTNFDLTSQKYEKVIENPQFGNALNRAKEIPLYLKMVYKVSNNRFVLVDGGFRERFLMEIWSVPEGAEIPKATPTLERKDIKFAKGKPKPPRRMACCYDEC